MRTLTRKLPYTNSSETFRLTYLTDLHLGSAACEEKLLRRDIAAIANDDHALWLGGGDYIDCISRKGDKRYQEATLASWLRGKDDTIGQQRDYVLELLKPIASKCIGLLTGNHEAAALRYQDRDVYKDIVRGIASAAGVEPDTLALGVHGFVVLQWRLHSPNSSGHGWPLVIYAAHGYGGGRLPGGHALALERALGTYEADLLLFGHRHVRVTVDKTIVTPTRTKLRMAAFIASYLGASIKRSDDLHPVDTYADHLGLPPLHLGTSPIIITPNTRRFDIVLSNTVGLTNVA